MIKAVIFDYDGTLSNRQKSVYSFYRDYLRPYVKEMSELEYESMLQDLMIYDCNGAIQFEYRIKLFLYKYGKYFPEDFATTFRDSFFKNVYAYNVLKDDAIDVLKQLKGKYRLGILSNGDSTIQHGKIDHVQISDFFDEIVVTGDVGIHKPDKRIFEYALNKLDVKAEEAIMVGDVYASDILGAINAGMKTAWILEDSERPNDSYDGYRIRKLSELLDILRKEAL